MKRSLLFVFVNSKPLSSLRPIACFVFGRGLVLDRSNNILYGRVINPIAKLPTNRVRDSSMNVNIPFAWGPILGHQRFPFPFFSAKILASVVLALVVS